MTDSFDIPAKYLNPWFNTGEKEALQDLLSFFKDEEVTPLREYFEDLIGDAVFITDGDYDDIIISGNGTVFTLSTPKEAELLARANHTGTQVSSTISDFSEAVDDRVNALLLPGTNITLNYDDTANTLTIGTISSFGFTTDADDNMFAGENAADSITTGGTNLAIGKDSLTDNTSGDENVAVGLNSLTNNTTGNYNTALGVNAGRNCSTGNSNTAVGNNALYGNGAVDIGDENTAVGDGALYKISTGTNNVAVGSDAGLEFTTGNFNVAIGESAGPATGTFSNTIAIGYQAAPTASNETYIGNGSTTSAVIKGVITGTCTTQTAKDNSTKLASTAYVDNATKEVVSAVSSSSGVLNFDCSLGDYFTITLTENVTSITFTNLPASGKAQTIMVRITQHASSAKTMAFPSSFKWAGGTLGVISSTTSAIDVLAITTFDQGTRWEATLAKAFA